MWRDLNQDGISQADDLKTLAETGIASINLAAATVSSNLGNGITLNLTGSYTCTDGSTGTAGNLNFTKNAFYQEFTDSVTLIDQAEGLPELHGSGSVRNLREAVSLSPDLATALTAYAVESTRAGQITRLDGLLKTWSETSAFVTSAGSAHGAPP